MSKFWIIRYYHRHGDDVFPMFQENEPTQEEIISELDDFEPDRDDEGLDVYGPFIDPRCEG